jgi:hypothetical protein
MSPSEWQNIAWIGWLKEPGVLIGLGIGSIVMIGASLLALRFYLARIPVDYFDADRRRCLKGPLSWIVRILKNLLGLLFLCLGIAMLVLPGQGILTMLVGISLLDFPGKYRIERRIVSMPGVLKAINNLRARSGQPPLQVSGRSSDF